MTVSDSLTGIVFNTARSPFIVFTRTAATMLSLAILLLPVTAALDGLRITVTSKFASNATTESSALDRLARAQR